MWLRVFGYSANDVRWIVESRSKPGLVRWPEDLHDVATSLARDLRAEGPHCHVADDGALTARFTVEAGSKEEAERLARQIVGDVVADAGVAVSSLDPVPHLELTRRRALADTATPL